MVQTIGKQNKMVAILFLTIGKQIFKLFGIPMLDIQAPSVLGGKKRLNTARWLYVQSRALLSNK